MLSLPYARFLQVLEQAAKAQEDELRRLAFLGWQVQAPFLSEPVSFSDYLERLGLGEKSEARAEMITAGEALEKASEVLDRFKAAQP